MKKLTLLAVAVFSLSLTQNVKAVKSVYQTMRQLTTEAKRDKNFLEILNSTVRKGIVPRAEDMDIKSKTNGTTLLMHAAMEKNTDVLTGLIANGADVEAVSDDNSNALMYAAQLGRANAIKVLLSNLKANGVNIPKYINRTNNEGKSALVYAKEYRSEILYGYAPTPQIATSIEKLLKATPNSKAQAKEASHLLQQLVAQKLMLLSNLQELDPAKLTQKALDYAHAYEAKSKTASAAINVLKAAEAND